MEVKRVRIEAKFQPKKCAKRKSIDRISELPDGILVDILSFLSLKEAGRTSVLSSCWINLWKHTPSLDFDAQSSLEKIETEHAIRLELIQSERLKYVNWVDSVVQSHKSPTLKEFRIRFTLDRKAENSITRWLQFAFAERQVQRFELNLGTYCSWPNYYHFTKESSPKLLQNIKSIKELSFKYVHFKGGDIEFFLKNCPLLERLVVHLSDYVSAIEVCGPSLRLKHLELVNFHALKSLKVSAPNLTSLRFTMPRSCFDGLLLEYAPMLVELSVTCNDCGISVKKLISALSRCISRLEVLCLFLLDREETDELFNLPQMPKLKKLVIEYAVYKCNKSLVRLTALLRASPHLEEFVLKYNCYKLVGEEREVKDPIRSPHRHLKVFKFAGYYCHNTDVELLSYILENGVVLEKIIIDCSNRFPNFHGLDAEQIARNYAKQQLEPRVPRHVELVIL